MSALISETTRLAIPDHRMVGIADQAAAALEEPTVPGDGFLGINTNEVLIATGQDTVEVSVHLQLWDSTPPPPVDPEMTQTITLDLPTGSICIDQTVAGWISDVMQLPPGRYHVTLAAWDRQRLRDLVTEVGQRTDFNTDHPDFAALTEGTYGRERYLAQFWQQT